MRIKLNHKKKRLPLDVKVCSGLGKFSGLMFVRREKAKALLFSFRKSAKMRIHSIFVFFPFLCVWINEDKIVDLKIVRPFTLSVSCKKPFSKLVEIPCNNKYKELIHSLVGSRRCRNI